MYKTGLHRISAIHVRVFLELVSLLIVFFLIELLVSIDSVRRIIIFRSLSFVRELSSIVHYLLTLHSATTLA